MKYAWVAKNKAVWPITLMSGVLGVSVSGFFEHQRWRNPGPSQPGGQRVSNEALLAHIRAIQAAAKGEYGWPRVWKALLAQSMRVGKDRVQRLMKARGTKARHQGAASRRGTKARHQGAASRRGTRGSLEEVWKKFVVTTDSRHNLPIAPNLLQHNFNPSAPDQVWSGDITYIQTGAGWLYLAAVIDLFSRQVVGMEHAAAHASQSGHRCAAHGVVQAAAQTGLDLPFGPRQPVLRQRLPGRFEELRHAQLDEPQGGLLGTMRRPKACGPA